MQTLWPTAQPPPPSSLSSPSEASPIRETREDQHAATIVPLGGSLSPVGITLPPGRGFRDALTALLDEVEDRLVAQHEIVARERESAICAKFDALQLENIELRKLANGHMQVWKEEGVLGDVDEQHSSRPTFPGEQLRWNQQPASRFVPQPMPKAGSAVFDEVVVEDPFPEDMPVPASERCKSDEPSTQAPPEMPPASPVLYGSASSSTAPAQQRPESSYSIAAGSNMAAGRASASCAVVEASSVYESQGSRGGGKSQVNFNDPDGLQHTPHNETRDSQAARKERQTVSMWSDDPFNDESLPANLRMRDERKVADTETTRCTVKITEAERTFRMIQEMAENIDRSGYLHASRFGSVKRFQMGKTEEVIDMIMGILILLNAVQIGMSSDLNRYWRGWMVMDCFFAVAFVVEMALKIRLVGLKKHLCGANWYWSMFDAAMTVQAIFEVFLSFLHFNAVRLSLFRIVRLFRLTRILRLLRLPIFRDLLMMIDGVIGGSRTLGWSIILLIVPLYAVAIMFRETLGETDEDTVHSRIFESLGESFFTVFRCVMGDCNDQNGAPIFVHIANVHGWYYGAFYCTLVTLTTFGLFNVIIAIYVENTVVAAKSNEKLQRRRRLSDQKRLAVLSMHLVDRFRAASSRVHRTSQNSESKRSEGSLGLRQGDEEDPQEEMFDDSNLIITADLFAVMMQDDEIQVILDELDIATEDRMDLFEILDADGSGELHVSELLQGIRRLRGDARRSDVIANGLIIRALQDNFDTFAEQVKLRQKDMKENMKRNGEISSRLEEKFDLFESAVRERQLQMVANVERNGEYARKLQDKFDAFEQAARLRRF